MSRTQSALIIGGVVCVAVCGSILVYMQSQPQPQPRSSVPLPRMRTIVVGRTSLRVTEALTKDEQARGLSGSPMLDPDSGMLFDFGTEIAPAMWMKGMNYGLDFLWINAAGNIVGITPDVLPNTYPTTFRSPVPSRFVLEVNSGWAKAHSIVVGDRILWN